MEVLLDQFHNLFVLPTQNKRKVFTFVTHSDY